MGLLERLGGKKPGDFKTHEEIVNQAMVEQQSSRIKSAFEDETPRRKVETFTGRNSRNRRGLLSSRIRRAIRYIFTRRTTSDNRGHLRRNTWSRSH